MKKTYYLWDKSPNHGHKVICDENFKIIYIVGDKWSIFKLGFEVHANIIKSDFKSISEDEALVRCI